MRIAIGNGLIRLAGWVRSLSLGLAALLTVALLIGGAFELFSPNQPYPEPFEPGNDVGFGTWAWQTLTMIGALVVGGRLLLFWLLCTLAQLAYPAAYKAEMERVYAEAAEKLGYPP